MIFGIGTDIIETERIGRSVEKLGDRFLKKIFGENEITYCLSKKNSIQHFAARFAAKESFVKALGTGFDGTIGWNEICVVNDKNGKPSFELFGRAAKKIKDGHIKSIYLTLSHIKGNAVAVAIFEK